MPGITFALDSYGLVADTWCSFFPVLKMVKRNELHPFLCVSLQIFNSAVCQTPLSFWDFCLAEMTLVSWRM